MTLLPLPDHRTRRIVVGTTLRKPLIVLKPYLDSLEWQTLPKGTEFSYCFIPDFAPDQLDAQQYLFEWVNRRRGVLIQGLPQQGPDFADGPGIDSHQWQLSAMARVGANKNLILKYMLDSKADGVWLVDGDLILDRTTFLSLDSCDRPIVTGVYWTRWGRATAETTKVFAAPQVWLVNPYQLHGRGLDEAEFRQKLLSRGLVRVYGFGANTLFQRKVIEAGISFEYLPDLPLTGLNAGEDRHLSLRCERLHIESYADTWPDIFHIYHADDDIGKIPEMVARLGAEHLDRAGVGDLISLRLRPLEPLPIAPGRFSPGHAQFVRGRLGALKMIPEIEEAVYALTRGNKKTVRAHFPPHHPMPFLRGRTRLIEITLIDVKPNGYPPIVEEDLFVGSLSGKYTHMESLTATQRDSIAELQNADA